MAWKTPNIRELVERLRRLHSEATTSANAGGYQVPLGGALSDAGLQKGYEAIVKKRKRARMAEGAGKSYKADVKNPKVSGEITVYPDASGAPATLTYDGFTFAFDVLGEIKSNRLGARSGREGRKARSVAVKVLEAAYKELLAKHTNSEWREANKKMYA